MNFLVKSEAKNLLSHQNYKDQMSSIQINTKSIARIAAIQTIYQFHNSNNESDIDTILLRMVDFYKDANLKNDHDLADNTKFKLKPSYNHLQELVRMTFEHLAEIDEIIEQHLTKEWKIENISNLLLAVLRTSISEMKYFPETPRKVIINEYTDIASDMLDDGEIGFVNSLLDKYAFGTKD